MADPASRGSSTRCCRAGFLEPGDAIPADESAAKRPSHSAASSPSHEYAAGTIPVATANHTAGVALAVGQVVPTVQMQWKNPGMSDVARLVTVVDIDDRVVDAKDVEARLVDGPPPKGAEPGLAPPSSGERVDDPREMSFSALHQAVLHDGRRLTLLDDRGWSVHGPPGPDEPYGGHSQADMESEHWSHLANILRDQGMQIDPEELSRLPHDVELSMRLRARIASA